MATNITQIKLIDLVPPSIRNDPQVQAAAEAIDKELQAVTAAIPQTILIARIDELSEQVLDLLAWQFHVDFYEPIGFSIDKKRAMIKQSIAWHRHKGTPWAVEQIVNTAFAQSEVLEWFDYGGDPYHFKIKTIDVLKNDEAYRGLVRAVDTVKNTRSRLDGIQIHREINVGELGKKSLYFGFLSGKGGKETIGLPYPNRASVKRNMGFVHHSGGYKKINISLPTKAPVTMFAGLAICRGGKITVGRRL